MENSPIDDTLPPDSAVVFDPRVVDLARHQPRLDERIDGVRKSLALMGRRQGAGETVGRHFRRAVEIALEEVISLAEREGIHPPWQPPEPTGRDNESMIN